MYNVIRSDSWVVVPIYSILRPGKTMEGTRLTLVKVARIVQGGNLCMLYINLLICLIAF